MAKSFKALLAEYPRTRHAADGSLPRLSATDLAHLRRWASDERADEVWNTVDRAANSRGILLPARFFVQEVLGARDIATSIKHRRANRERYREYAARMEGIAKLCESRSPIVFR